MNKSLWNLIRLKALKYSVSEECKVYFLLAGKKEDMAKLFKSKIFREGSHSPLIHSSRRTKSFNLIKNRDNQRLLDSYIENWKERYQEFIIPSGFSTKLEDDSSSAMEKFRFQAKVWEIN